MEYNAEIKSVSQRIVYVHTPDVVRNDKKGNCVNVGRTSCSTTLQQKVPHWDSFLHDTRENIKSGRKHLFIRIYTK